MAVPGVVQKTSERLRKRGEGKTTGVGVLAHREAAGVVVRGCRGRRRRYDGEVQLRTAEDEDESDALDDRLARCRGSSGRRGTGDAPRMLNGDGGGSRRAGDDGLLHCNLPPTPRNRREGGERRNGGGEELVRSRVRGAGAEAALWWRSRWRGASAGWSSTLLSCSCLCFLACTVMTTSLWGRRGRKAVWAGLDFPVGRRWAQKACLPTLGCFYFYLFPLFFFFCRSRIREK